MQELRLVAVSEDGSYAILVVPGRSGRFALPIDERLRAVARGQFSRLAQYEIEVESPLRPKEIQDRIRAGETAEEIADAAGLPVERVRRFEGPPLAERARWAQEAQRATVRGRPDSGPGPRLGQIVGERLAQAGADAEEAEWDSRKRPDGAWQVQLAFTVAGRLHIAEWAYDIRGNHVTPDNDEAIRLCLGEADWPSPRPAATATVTPLRVPAASRGAIAAPAGDSARPAAAARPRHPDAADPGAAAPGAADVADVAGPTATARRAAPPAGPPGVAGGGFPAPAGDPDTAPQPPAPAGTPAQLAAGTSPGEPAARPRRPSGRPRRSSVPSWDEIMFGTSRPSE